MTQVGNSAAAGTAAPGPASGATSRPRRRSAFRRALGLLATVALLVVLAGAPLPAYTIGPGPAFSLADQLTIDGESAVGSLHGDYLFTTVAVEDADLSALIRSWFSSELTVAARSAVLPAGQDVDAFIHQQQEAFREEVSVAAQVASSLLPLEGRQDGGGLDVDIANDIVGGPSAGLLVAMAAYDVAAAQDLAAGRRIAGTGALEADGTVVEVGSVALKVAGALRAGAEVFLVPAAQAPAAERALPRGAGMEIVGVGTFGDAVAALAGG